MLLLLWELGPVGIEGSVGRRNGAGALPEAELARGPVGVSGMAWPFGANLWERGYVVAVELLFWRNGAGGPWEEKEPRGPEGGPWC